MVAASGASVVVVGGGLAGARTCAELRKKGHAGRLTLLCQEGVPPYDRPPLSKAVLQGKREAKPLRVDYPALDIDIRLGWTAQTLDLPGRRVHSAHDSVPFDHLVIATGSTPITLPGLGSQTVLRTDVDARSLRDQLIPGARVVLIGAGWIGAEVATVAVARGCRVTCVELAEAPCAQVLGADLGARFAAWWRDVDLRLGQAVGEVEPYGVRLDDGTLLPADVVVTGVGVRPATAWLAGTGLALDPGVSTDEFLRTEQDGVLALGDVASWWSRRFATRMSVQHWDDASSAAVVAASSIVQGSASELIHDPVPYFWSDQWGHRIEYVGHHASSDEVVLREDGEGGWSAAWLDEHGRLSAALTVDRPKELVAARDLVAAGRKLSAQALGGTPFVELAQTST